MADRIDGYADHRYDLARKKIRRIYREAGKEVQGKISGFLKAHAATDAGMRAKLEAGKMSEVDYRAWMQGQVFIGKRWESVLDEVTRTYVNADEEARRLVGEEGKGVFRYSANQTAETIGNKTGVPFAIYDRTTVDRLIRDNPQLLPEWKIDEPKDYEWNERRVRNIVTQGIIQGESVREIGARLTEEMSAGSAKHMEMFARTAVTGAQNAGRVERMRESERLGVTVLKKWLAVRDKRTRDEHLMLDGQTRKPEEDFEVYGERIAYPGDPTAPAHLVYNCRCTLVYVYPDYE